MNIPAAIPDLTVKSDQRKLEELLSLPKLTNRESADVFRILANRMTTLSDNDVKLHKAMGTVGASLDRLEKAVFDTREKDGKIKSGIARSLRETQLTVGTLQRNLTEVHMGNQVMRQILPWAGEWLGKYGRMPTIEEYNVKYAEFAKILVAEGEKAAAYQQFIENAVKEARNCKGCKMWRSLSIAGQEPGCSRNLIQVKCPKCTDLVPMPQSPSSLGKCPKCEAQLLRETSVVPYALFCQNYEPDLDAIRQGCLQKGIPAEIVEAVFPTQKEPNATVEEGAAATAPASDPAGDAGR